MRARLLKLPRRMDAAVDVPLLRTKSGLHAVLGALPLAGHLADVYFKAHLPNLKRLQKELGESFIDVTAVPRRS